MAGQNSGCHKTHHFKPKLVLQVEQITYVELLELVLDFVMNPRLKILNDISMKSRECLNKDVQKKEERRRKMILSVHHE